MTAPVLTPRLPVARQDIAGIEGCLGGLFIDASSGRLLALTAAQLVDHGRRELREDTQTGARLLSRHTEDTPGISCDLTGARDQSAAAMVAVANLRPGFIDEKIYADTSQPNASPTIVRRLVPLLGRMVRIQARSRPIVEAVLVSPDSVFEMPDPAHGRPCVFNNAIELHGPPDEPLLAKGDAGALVVDEHGNWVGVIVAARENVAFAAPLYPAAARLGVEPPTLGNILAHNKMLLKLLLERDGRNAFSGVVVSRDGRARPSERVAPSRKPAPRHIMVVKRQAPVSGPQEQEVEQLVEEGWRRLEDAFG